MPLSSSRRDILRAAVARSDQLLTCPDGLSSKAVQALFSRLVRAGHAEPIPPRKGQPSWPGKAGEATVLHLTLAGRAALGSDLPPREPSRELHLGASPAGGQQRLTKQTRMLALLQRAGGATLDELMSVTGWLPHSTRAALTGLRKKGHALKRTRNETGQTVYRVAPASFDPEVPAGSDANLKGAH